MDTPVYGMDTAAWITPMMPVSPAYRSTYRLPMPMSIGEVAVSQPQPATAVVPQQVGTEQRTINSCDNKSYHSVTFSSMTDDCIGVREYSGTPHAIRATTILSAIDFVMGVIGADDLDSEEIAPKFEGIHRRAIVRVHNGSCVTEDDWQVFSSYAITASVAHTQRHLFHQRMVHPTLTLGDPMITPHRRYHAEDVTNAVFALRGARS